MTKVELRKVFLANQKSLSADEREVKSFAIAELFFQNFDLSEIIFLHSFLPIEKFREIDTRPIFERVWREFPNIQALVPRVDFQTNEIENLKFSSATETAKNVWHISVKTYSIRIKFNSQNEKLRK